MKKLMFTLIFVLFTLLCACSSKVNSTPEYSEQAAAYEIAKGVNLSSTQKADLEKMLRDAGKPRENEVSILPLDAMCYPDGAIDLYVLVRNGFSHSINKIYGNIDIKVQDKIIASKYFELNPNNFGVLPPDKSRCYSLKFPKDHVFVKDFSFKDLTISQNLVYSY